MSRAVRSSGLSFQLNARDLARFGVLLAVESGAMNKSSKSWVIESTQLLRKRGDGYGYAGGWPKMATVRT